MIERIETERLVLRKAEARDLEPIWQRVWQDGRLAATMLWAPTETREAAEERLARTMAYQANNYAYFVCLRETDEPIGFGGVRELEPGVWDETGLCIAFDWQGRGYGKELLRALIDLVFRELGGRCFHYSCFHGNAASAALCRSCGFVCTGSRPETRERDGFEYLCDCYELRAPERVLSFTSFGQLDPAKLMAVYAESNEDNIDYFYPGAADHVQALRQVEEGFLAYLRDDFFSVPGNSCWVLERCGRWLSALRLYPVREGLYYLEALETRPDCRRQGCASLLLHALTDELKTRGPFRLCDCVGLRNIASRRTHERCGFRAVGEPGFDWLRGEPDEGTVGMVYEYEK